MIALIPVWIIGGPFIGLLILSFSFEGPSAVGGGDTTVLSGDRLTGESPLASRRYLLLPVFREVYDTEERLLGNIGDSAARERRQCPHFKHALPTAAIAFDGFLVLLISKYSKGDVMSIIDKVVAAVTPPESEEARAEARAKARSAASAWDWLSAVLDHHLQIEAAFANVQGATDAASRTKAFKELALVLTGHSIAEEASVYLALAEADEKSHATIAYTAQSAAKLQMGLLENLPPMSQEFVDKLEHIRGAVAHHVYEEEGTWFPELKAKLPAAAQAKLAERYAEQFSRYMGSEAKAVR